MMWAIANSPNPYFFETMSSVEVLRAPKEKFLEFMEKEPTIVLELTKRVLSGLSGLLWVMEHLLFSSARTKVISVILICSKRFGTKNGNREIIIELPLTHQNIASLAGLTRETTSIELGKLSKEKIIAFKNRLLVVKDIDKIEEELFTPVIEGAGDHAL